MRAAALLLLLASAARGDDRVRAFFEETGGHELADALARIEAPALAELPFGQVAIDGARVEGWIESDGRIRTGLFAVRRFEGPVAPLHPHEALRAFAMARAPDLSPLLAHWVAALQAGDGKGARRAWTLLARRDDLRTALLRALGAEWPSAWEEGRRRDRALAALRAMDALAADAFWRGYVARRRAYVEACSDAIPEPPGDDAPPERAVRLWVEGLRRMAPLYSCIIGTPPHFYGEPDAYMKLKEIGAPAYPTLVVAAEDPRTAGRGVSLGGEGEPSEVGFVASCLLGEMLPYAEDGEILERWIQDGAWRDERSTALWFARHGTRPHTLVTAAVELRGDPGAVDALRGLADHPNAPVRISAAAALGELPALERLTDAVLALELPDATFYVLHRPPEGVAAAYWAAAVGDHGDRGMRLLASAMQRGGPGARIHVAGGLRGSRAGAEAVPLLERCLDDPSPPVGVAAAGTLSRISAGAIRVTADDDALIAAARAWVASR